MYGIERVDIMKHDEWNIVCNIAYFLNIEQVSDIETRTVLSGMKRTMAARVNPRLRTILAIAPESTL